MVKRQPEETNLVYYQDALMRLSPIIGKLGHDTGKPIEFFDICYILGCLFDYPDKMQIGMDFAIARKEYLDLKEKLSE